MTAPTLREAAEALWAFALDRTTVVPVGVEYTTVPIALIERLRDAALDAPEPVDALLARAEGRREGVEECCAVIQRCWDAIVRAKGGAEREAVARNVYHLVRSLLSPAAGGGEVPRAVTPGRRVPARMITPPTPAVLTPPPAPEAPFDPNATMLPPRRTPAPEATPAAPEATPAAPEATPAGEVERMARMAYAAHMDGVPYPTTWEQLPEHVREQFRKSSRAVAEAVLRAGGAK